MKRSLLWIAVLLILVSVPAFAQFESQQMPGSQYPLSLGQYPPFQGTPWVNRGPGMGGYGMGNIGPGGAAGRWGGGPSMAPGTMGSAGYYNMGPGVMMGQGMTQFGMGPGMIRGVGVMGYISSEAFQKFFDETRENRKELHNLMFDYAELLRKPEYDPAERVKIENKIMELRQKVYNKAPRYQWPFK